MNLNKKKIKQKLKLILTQGTSPLKLGLAVGLGVFIAVGPSYGFQTIIVLVLAHILKLNKAAALLGNQASLPWFYPFWIYLDFLVGNWITGGTAALSFPLVITPNLIGTLFFSILLGSLIVGSLSGGLFFLITYLICLKLQRNNNDNTLDVEEQQPDYS
ncbi:DUF2062 domain-containing protein [bacterium]|nr:DUF2062 domain-containing protein [bacterium]